MEDERDNRPIRMHKWTKHYLFDISDHLNEINVIQKIYLEKQNHKTFSRNKIFKSTHNQNQTKPN